MIDYDQMSLADLVGYVKALRLESEAWGNRDELVLRVGGHEVRSDTAGTQGNALHGDLQGAGREVVDPVRGRLSSGGAVPVDPLYAAWYERQLAERPEGHAAHKRIRSLTRLWATCVECHDAKVRRLQASKNVHVREKANVMAARRGVK